MKFFLRNNLFLLACTMLVIFAYILITNRLADNHATFGTEIPRQNEPEMIIWSPIASIEQEIVANYLLDHPEKMIRVVNVYEEDFQQKIRTFTAADLTLPDIITSSNTTFLADNRLFEDLSSSAFSFDIDGLLAAVNERKVFTSIPRSPGLMAFLFRRDLSNRYLGSDKPNEIRAGMATWDSFLGLASTIYHNSGGLAYSLPSFECIEDIMVFQGMHTDEIDTYRKRFTIDAPLTSHIDNDSSLYFDSLNQGNVVFFPVYNWEILYNIRQFDRNLTDRWDIVPIPGPRFLGNSLSYAVLKSSDKKKDARDYIEWACLSEQGNKFIVDSFQIIPSSIEYLNMLDWDELRGLGSTSHIEVWKHTISDLYKEMNH